MKHKKLGGIIGFTLIFLLLACGFASAFAITTYYWDEKPFMIEPGQTAETYLELQNMASGEEVTLIGEITEGADIASLAEKEFVVPPGRKDIPAIIKIAIPADVSLGTKYNITVMFKQKIKTGGNEMLQIVSGVGSTIPVLVGTPVEEQAPPPVIPKEKSFDWVTVGISLVVLVIILAVIKFFYSKRKKR